MDTEEPGKWREIFTNENSCDYCEKSGVYIAKVIVQPFHTADEKGHKFAGVLLAKKCWECCEE